MASLRVAVFASGEGTNFAALAAASSAGRLAGASVELLVSDRPSAPVVAKAQAAGIDAWTFAPKDYASREGYESEILNELHKRGVGLIVLAGYMRILTPILVEAFEGRIINIHPSLLPAFPGMHAIRQALAHGSKVTGVTVHFVDNGLDSGPIIAQRAIEVAEDETEASLAERMHAAENVLYPWVVRQFAAGLIALEDRRVRLTDSILPENDSEDK